MNYYIFNTESEAIDYDQLITDASNYDTTSNWANPIKHPTKEKWAIAVNSSFSIEGKQSQTLTSDWFPNEL